MKSSLFTMPHIGMRNVKTAVATTLCALAYLPFGRSPAFACIGAIFGMGADMRDSKLNGGNRLFGTMIGGFLGMALFWVYVQFYPNGDGRWLLVLLICIGTILLILMCQKFWVGGIQPGGVVLSLLLFNTPVETYVSYALNRIFDTAVGVIVALAINYYFPRERILRWIGRGDDPQPVENNVPDSED